MLNERQESKILQLNGKWKYVLDPLDEGEAEKWYESLVTESVNQVTLPGTLSSNEIGEMPVWSDKLDRESVRSLRQRYSYIGAAWYEYETNIPAEWTDKRMLLFLERVMFQSTLWINGRLVGQQDSLSVAHEYEISSFIQSGRNNRITLRIDNRDIQNLGQHASAYTEETQSIWNGIIGRIQIHALEKVWIDSLHIYPKPDLRSVVVKGSYHNVTKQDGYANVCIYAVAKQNGKHYCDKYDAEVHKGQQLQKSMYVPASSTESFEWEYDMGENPLLWDEFNPNVYEMSIEGSFLLEEQKQNQITNITVKQTFGLRYFHKDGQNLKINGRPIFLRGTLECCIFPHTGHPPMDIESWLRVFRIAKDYGLNHIRFHSWCPPEAAFQAADELGVYLQIESPMWMDTWNTTVGMYPEHYTYLPQEARRIAQVYGNHPSFCIYSNGNELNGDFELLHQIVADLKSYDNRRLYTLTSNWDRPLDSADDLFIAQSVDGIGVRGQYFPEQLALSTELDFVDAVSKRPVPVISHEVGQFAVYPDVQEIEKYNGVLRPVNLEVIRADLETCGLLGNLRQFVHGSGMFALQLYRDEIEAALRTPNLGGFQLLDLHDFPGQSTAIVGILNAFWESKGFIKPTEFRKFCDSTVLLLRMPKRMYTNDELFKAEISIAHFGEKELLSSSVQWTIKDVEGRILDRGSLLTDKISFGSGQRLGSIESHSLNQIQNSAKLTISLELVGSEITNDWFIWVYDSVNNEPLSLPDIMVKRSLDEEMEQNLEKGGRVLFLLKDSELVHTIRGKFHPVFWSPVHFASQDPCGIIVDSAHPALKDFPTAEYAEYQWQDLLNRSHSLVVNKDLPFDPIVHVIPNFYHNQKLTNLTEYRIGNGRLLICGIDIEDDIDSRPAAAQLRNSILDYMITDSFEPSISITLNQLRQLLELKVMSTGTEAAPNLNECKLTTGIITSSADLPN